MLHSLRTLLAHLTLALATSASGLQAPEKLAPASLCQYNHATGQIQAGYGYNPQRDNGVAPLYARVPAKDSAGNPTGDYRYTYFHNDHLGTPQRLTDKAGNLLWSAQYDAYGKAQVQTTASAQLATVNPLRQPGQYLDLETGLHYNDRRCYDADTGRYASRDPIGFEGGINLYSFQASGQLSGFSV
jgi:RHS repeat-associated protein